MDNIDKSRGVPDQPGSESSQGSSSGTADIQFKTAPKQGRQEQGHIGLEDREGEDGHQDTRSAGDDRDERPPENEERPSEDGDRLPDDGEAGAEGYDRMAASTADYQALAAAVQDFTRIVEQLRRELREEAATRQTVHDQQLGVSAQVLSAVQQMQLEIAEMLRKGTNQDPGLGFSATAHAASARSGTKYARKRWQGPLWDAAWDTLRSRIFPLLWNIIARLVRVKEWTVGGQVGTGVLGIAQASISVTFG